jgi:hypothetical protein
MSNYIVHVATTRLVGKQKKDKTAPVKLRITFLENGKTVQKYLRLSSEHYCLEKEWDVSKQRFSRHFDDFLTHNELLEQKILRARRVLRKMELKEESFDYEQFVVKFWNRKKTTKIVDEIQKEVEKCRSEDRPSSAKSYAALKSAVELYAPNAVLVQCNLTWVQNFQAFLKIKINIPTILSVFI